MASSAVDDVHPRLPNAYPPTTPTSPAGEWIRRRSLAAGAFIGLSQSDGTHESRSLPRDAGMEGADASPAAARPSTKRPHASTTLEYHHSPPKQSPGHNDLARRLSTLGETTIKALGLAPASATYSQHAPKMEPQLTFFQRHFTKPISPDPEKIHHPDNRRFSFLSRGTILVGAAMILLLLGIIAAAVAVTFDNKHQTHDPAGDMVHTDPRSPIRLALLENFPDPTLVLKDGTYYAFATNNAAGIIDRPKNFTEHQLGVSNVQIATSKDFINWTLLNFEHDPLPKVGEWVTHGVAKGKIQIPKSQVWAPGIIKRDTDNKYVMYYSANKHAEDNKTESARVPAKGRHPPPHCIGAAVSETDDPAGPYTPVPELLACHLDQGGAIDAQPFRDSDGTLWIAYKIDGNNIGHGGSCGNTVAPIMPTPIKLQKMKPDGITKDGEEITILDRIESDGPLVEAPVLAKSSEGIYFLFYSSGCTRAPTYDLKYATAETITGPYTRAAKPLLQTGTYGLLAPGSADVLADGNAGFDMVFHARVRAPQGGVRAMFTTKLRFEGREVRMVRANSTLDDDERRM